MTSGETVSERALAAVAMSLTSHGSIECGLHGRLRALPPAEGPNTGHILSSWGEQLAARFDNHIEGDLSVSETTPSMAERNTIRHRPSFYNMVIGSTLLTPVAPSYRNDWLNRPEGAPETTYRPLVHRKILKICVTLDKLCVGAVNNQPYPFLSYLARIAEATGAPLESGRAVFPPEEYIHRKPEWERRVTYLFSNRIEKRDIIRHTKRPPRPFEDIIEYLMDIPVTFHGHRSRGKMHAGGAIRFAADFIDVRDAGPDHGGRERRMDYRMTSRSHSSPPWFDTFRK